MGQFLLFQELNIARCDRSRDHPEDQGRRCNSGWWEIYRLRRGWSSGVSIHRSFRVMSMVGNVSFGFILDGSPFSPWQ